MNSERLALKPRQQLLGQFHRTQSPYPPGRTVAEQGHCQSQEIASIAQLRLLQRSSGPGTPRHGTASADSGKHRGISPGASSSKGETITISGARSKGTYTLHCHYTRLRPHRAYFLLDIKRRRRGRPSPAVPAGSAGLAWPDLLGEHAQQPSRAHLRSLDMTRQIAPAEARSARTSPRRPALPPSGAS